MLLLTKCSFRFYDIVSFKTTIFAMVCPSINFRAKKNEIIFDINKSLIKSN